MADSKYNLSELRKSISKLEPTIKDTSLERQKLRLEIAKKMVNQGSYNSKTKEFSNPVRYNKRIDFVIGIAGGGKSSVLANPLSEENKSVVLDSDWAKEQLPEYNDGLGATRVHLESKLIFMLALENALKNNMNIVISIVGKTLQTIMQINHLAKENGYKQHLHLNEVPPNVACKRAIERFKETGRYIEPNYILHEIGYKPSENYEKLKKMNIFDSYEKYNNNVPFGEKPILIERISGGIKVDNPFTQKHFLETPVGKFAFTKEQNEFYNNTSDIELLELYLKEKKELRGLIPPLTFQVMKDRGLVFKGESDKDIIERLEKLKEELDDDLELEP